MSKATNTLFLCSRGRRLRFARSSEAALLQPSSRRLSFSARRRRSGEGSAPDPPRPRRGRAAGGRAGGAERRSARTNRARSRGRELRVAGVSARAADARLVPAEPNCRPYRCPRRAQPPQPQPQPQRGPQRRAPGLRTDGQVELHGRSCDAGAAHL